MAANITPSQFLQHMFNITQYQMDSPHFQPYENLHYYLHLNGVSDQAVYALMRHNLGPQYQPTLAFDSPPQAPIYTLTAQGDLVASAPAPAAAPTAAPVATPMAAGNTGNREDTRPVLAYEIAPGIAFPLATGSTAAPSDASPTASLVTVNVGASHWYHRDDTSSYLYELVHEGYIQQYDNLHVPLVSFVPPFKKQETDADGCMAILTYGGSSGKISHWTVTCPGVRFRARGMSITQPQDFHEILVSMGLEATLSNWNDNVHVFRDKADMGSIKDFKARHHMP